MQASTASFSSMGRSLASGLDRLRGRAPRLLAGGLLGHRDVGHDSSMEAGSAWLSVKPSPAARASSSRELDRLERAPVGLGERAGSP